MFDGFFSEFLTPFTLKGHNFLISNLFAMIFSALEEGFKFCLNTKRKKTFPWLLYSNTLVACNVQLS
jgi:hypothetical protein